MAVDWSCVTTGEGNDPTHCPYLGTRREEKERTAEMHSGEREQELGLKPAPLCVIEIDAES